MDKKPEDRNMDRPYYRKEKQEEETNGEALVEHLADLRKQLIKSLAVFVVFLLVVFTTMNYWFPYVTKGNELVVFGPFKSSSFTLLFV